jgi:hypothetical protein
VGGPAEPVDFIVRLDHHDADIARDVNPRSRGGRSASPRSVHAHSRCHLEWDPNHTACGDHEDRGRRDGSLLSRDARCHGGTERPVCIFGVEVVR